MILQFCYRNNRLVDCKLITVVHFFFHKDDFSLLIFLIQYFYIYWLDFLKEDQNSILVKSELIHFWCWHFLILLKKSSWYNIHKNNEICSSGKTLFFFLKISMNFSVFISYFKVYPKFWLIFLIAALFKVYLRLKVLLSLSKYI